MRVGGLVQVQHYANSWKRLDNGFDSAAWNQKHTAALNPCRDRLEDEGYAVKIEGQNAFRLEGTVATLVGKPDLIARKSGFGTIVDVKTGKPSVSDIIQVMVYMYAVPRVMRQHNGVVFSYGVYLRRVATFTVRTKDLVSSVRSSAATAWAVAVWLISAPLNEVIYLIKGANLTSKLSGFSALIPVPL